MSLSQLNILADGETTSSGWSPGAAVLGFGGASSLLKEAYLQFALPIPAGATVREAMLQIVPAADSTASSPATARLRRWNSGDEEIPDWTLPSDYSAVGDAASATLGSWTEGTPVLIDVATLVSAAVAASGYAAGDLFTLRVDTADTAVGNRSFHGTSAGLGAVLSVRWEKGAVDGVIIAAENLIADSATFRAAVGASNRFEALQRIHYAVLPEDAELPAAFCSEPDDLELIHRGTLLTLPSGTFRFQYVEAAEAAAVAEDGSIIDTNRAVRPTTARAAEIALEIGVLGRTAGYLIVRQCGLSGAAWIEAAEKRAQESGEDDPRFLAGQEILIAFGAKE